MTFLCIKRSIHCDYCRCGTACRGPKAFGCLHPRPSLRRGFPGQLSRPVPAARSCRKSRAEHATTFDARTVNPLRPGQHVTSTDCAGRRRVVCAHYVMWIRRCESPIHEQMRQPVVPRDMTPRLRDDARSNGLSYASITHSNGSGMPRSSLFATPRGFAATAFAGEHTGIELERGRERLERAGALCTAAEAPHLRADLLSMRTQARWFAACT